MRPRPPRSLRTRWLPRRAFWPVTAALALVAALLVAHAVQRAESTAKAYGERRLVTVATRQLDPGTALRPDDVRWAELPVVAVPGSAVGEDPVGRVVTQQVVAGEVLVAERLAPSDRTGPLALVPPGWRALALAWTEPVDPYRPGDRVDVLAAGRWVARDALVAGVADGVVTVAVPEDAAPAVARAALEGTVGLALVSPG